MGLAKEKILRQIIQILRQYPPQALPHPADIIFKLRGLNIKPSAEELISMIESVNLQQSSSKKPAIFLLEKASGYTSIRITEYGTGLPNDHVPLFLDTLNPQPQKPPSLSKPLSGASKPQIHTKATLLQMDAFKFEEFVARVLTAMGIRDVVVTPATRDNGIDIRGVVCIEECLRIPIAVQVKRYQANVSAPEIQKLRGSLQNGEFGTLITLSGFGKSAIEEAAATQKTHITLIDGETLISLANKYKVT